MRRAAPACGRVLRPRSQAYRSRRACSACPPSPCTTTVGDPRLFNLFCKRILLPRAISRAGRRRRAPGWRRSSLRREGGAGRRRARRDRNGAGAGAARGVIRVRCARGDHHPHTIPSRVAPRGAAAGAGRPARRADIFMPRSRAAGVHPRGFRGGSSCRQVTTAEPDAAMDLVISGGGTMTRCWAWPVRFFRGREGRATSGWSRRATW
jgi:hypothetical protein